MNYVRSMKIGEQIGVYSKTADGGENFYGSYHATQILDLFNELHNQPVANLDSWADYLDSFLQEDGSVLVRQQPFFDNPVLPGLDVKLHPTRGYTWAMRTLNRKPAIKASFVEPLLEGDTCRRWLESLDWSQCWRVSNQVLAVYTIFMGLKDWFGYNIVDDVIEKQIHPFLEGLLDPSTGFFGTSKGSELRNGLFGTIHLVPIFYDRGWDVKYIDRCIDSTIQCQGEDGSYWPGGKNCPDFDGAYMLANLSKLTDYRKEDVRKTAQKYLDHALMHKDMNNRGWRTKRRDWVNPDKAVIDPEFVMLDSWFYPQSIGHAADILKDSGYEGPYHLNPKSLHMIMVG